MSDHGDRFSNPLTVLCIMLTPQDFQNMFAYLSLLWIKEFAERYSLQVVSYLTLYTPTPQNGQTHSNNLSAFVVLALKGLIKKRHVCFLP